MRERPLPEPASAQPPASERAADATRGAAHAANSGTGGCHESLVAPWRLAYVSRQQPQTDPHDPAVLAAGGDPTCFLCLYAAHPEQDADHHVVLRTELSIVCLNRFPYSNGHMLVAPKRHVAALDDLTEAEAADLWSLVRESTRRLRLAMNAQGFNVGLNLGACAGAGVPGHLHIHVVPRWPGDANFMPVIANLRVIPQAFSDTYAALCNA